MDIAIRGHHMELTPAIMQHVKDRLQAALDQHASKVQSVSVVLEDANGPRGGIDQICKVHVHLFSGETLCHERRGDDLYANVSHLADTIKRRVGRHVGKRKRHAPHHAASAVEQVML